MFHEQTVPLLYCQNMSAFLLKGLRLVPVLCSVLLLGACDGWPLYLHIEPDKPPVPTSIIVNLLEDVTVLDDQIQELAPLPYPSVARIRGATASCGFDPDLDDFIWPAHLVEGENGSELVRIEGWYSGDVDYYSLALNQRGWLSVSLEWDNLPGEEGNAPYLPDEPDNDWSIESDLDFVLFDSSSLAMGTIVNDDGYSLSYPEQTTRAVAVDPDSPIVIAVACHHELPSGYTLNLALSSP